MGIFGCLLWAKSAVNVGAYGAILYLALPEQRRAINGMGLWSNFKNLPYQDWVESAPVRERG